MYGSRYFVTFTNGFSRKVWVFLKQKSKTFTEFKLWKEEVKNQIGGKIKYLGSHNGTEYTDLNFNRLCEKYDVQRNFSIRKTPHKGLWA